MKTKTYVKDSPIEGKGIFAKNNIKKAEIIGCCRGKIYSEAEAEKLNLPDHHLMTVGKDKIMLVEAPERYTNHSCDPNVGINKLNLVAIRNIKKDEEIFIDYDTLEFNWKMNCFCKSKNCRKVIRGYKYLPQELKDKYKDFTAEYLLNSK
ncbi:MAG: SET domain-containing protein [archaeon]